MPCCCPWLQISGVKVYGGPDRLVFFREASTGLSKLAYFWALDTWSYVGACLFNSRPLLPPRPLA